MSEDKKTEKRMYPGLVEWDEQGGVSLGVVVLPKGKVTVIDRWNGDRVEVPSHLLREAGAGPAVPARPHPYADVFQCLQKKIPMEGARAAKFQELCLKLAVVEMYPRYTEDLKAVFTPEQLKQVNEEVMAFAQFPIEQLYHLALFGHYGPRVKGQRSEGGGQKSEGQGDKETRGQSDRGTGGQGDKERGRDAED